MALEGIHAQYNLNISLNYFDRRPSNVCLCPFLPANPIAIKSSVFLVQHPREEKRRVRTDYLVKGCLPKEKCFVIKGKKFSPKR